MDLELEGLTLDKESHEVSVYISGYIAKKLTPRVAYCCASMIVGEHDNQEYFKILSKGGLTTVLPLIRSIIMSVAASQFLMKRIPNYQTKWASCKSPGRMFLTICVTSHWLCLPFTLASLSAVANKICCNIFLNNEIKRKSIIAVDDRVREFKRSKCDVPWILRMQLI